MSLALALTGCLATDDGPTASERKALVRQEAPQAIAIVARAVSGTDLYAETRWESCMAYPVWRYSGVALFTVPPGDRNAQLDAMQAALLKAGYAETRRLDHKVYTRRGRFVFVIEPVITKPPDPQRWKTTFWAEPCARYARRDRARIKQNGDAWEPLPLPR